MFLENEYARPLFDFEKGGPPKAFQCKLWPPSFPSPCDEDKPCGKVTRTERGMRMHLKQVHGIEEQPCLYSTGNQTDQESGKPRRLRLFTKENIAATIKRSSILATEPAVDQQTVPPQPTEPATKEKPSQKLIFEEK